MKHILQIFSLAAILSLALVSTTYAGIFSLPRGGTATNYHPLTGASSIMRLTLVGMDRFVVLKTGDRNANTGELNNLTLTLSATSGEYDSMELSTGQMRNLTTGSYGNRAYIKVHKQDIMETGNPRGYFRMPDIWINVRVGDRITLNLDARELDCTGERVCNRGDSGHYKIELTVPSVLSPAPTTCGRMNSAPLTFRNGQIAFASFDTLAFEATGDVLLRPIRGTFCLTPAR